MKTKLILICLVLALAAIACNFPGFAPKTPILEPTPTLDHGMSWYYGEGMQLLLPPSFVERNIEDDLPQILTFVKAFLGESESPLTSIIENLEENVAWWGYDTASPAISPNRLLILRNQDLDSLPVSMISGALGLLMGKDGNAIQSDNLRLADRAVSRFTYSRDNNAWAGYFFKEQDQLWLVLYMTTPTNLVVQTEDLEFSIESMVIEPFVPTPQP